MYVTALYVHEKMDNIFSSSMYGKEKSMTCRSVGYLGFLGLCAKLMDQLCNMSEVHGHIIKLV